MKVMESVESMLYNAGYIFMFLISCFGFWTTSQGGRCSHIFAIMMLIVYAWLFVLDFWTISFAIDYFGFVVDFVDFVIDCFGLEI